MKESIKHSLYGASFIVSLCFLEAIAVAETTRTIPRHMAVRWLLDFLPEFNTSILIIPMLIFLALSLIPIKPEKTSWIYIWMFSNLITFVLLASATRHFEYGHYGPVWIILVIPAIGLILWVDNDAYTYGLFISAVVWDLLAAIRGPLVGWYDIPEPYAPKVPFYISITIDATLIIILSILWKKRFSINNLIKNIINIPTEQSQ